MRERYAPVLVPSFADVPRVFRPFSMTVVMYKLLCLDFPRESFQRVVRFYFLYPFPPTHYYNFSSAVPCRIAYAFRFFFFFRPLVRPATRNPAVFFHLSFSPCSPVVILLARAEVFCPPDGPPWPLLRGQRMFICLGPEFTIFFRCPFHLQRPVLPGIRFQKSSEWLLSP